MRGHDPLEAWRYGQRVAHDELLRVERDARLLGRILALLFAVGAMTVIW